MLSEEKPLVMKELNPKFSQGRWIILCWLSVFWLLACQPQNKTDDTHQSNQSYSSKTIITHAIGFDIIDYQDWRELLLFRHYNDFVDTVRFALVTEKAQAPTTFQENQVIQLPVKRIGALSTTHLPMFNLLEATENLVAVETRRYIYNEEIRALVDNGSITELAPSGKLNLEMTLASDLDLLMGVGYPNSQNDDYQTLQRTGLSVVMNADWQEKTLLGRAEWIKLLGVLLGKEEQANVVFAEIEIAFNETLALVEEKVSSGPSVVTGLADGDSWYVAGGNSFANHILQVAKTSYPWAATESTGSVRLDFETVYQQGLTADYWLVPSTAKTMEEIIQADERYQDFCSFKTGQIYNIYGRYRPNGGNDYYESAVMAPHVVLKDVVKIFHPELLPDHELVYYNQLR